LLHRPNPSAGVLEAGGGQLETALEAFAPPMDWWRLARGFLDAILEDTLTPSSWQKVGPLPTGLDGLRQTQVVCAIVKSAETGRVVELH
jgi:predicted dehydrogenase